MPNNPKPYLWGKKFCHTPSSEKPGQMMDVIHIADKSETLCGTPMLGNNYANQETDKANCPKCIKIHFNPHKP